MFLRGTSRCDEDTQQESKRKAQCNMFRLKKYAIIKFLLKPKHVALNLPMYKKGSYVLCNNEAGSRNNRCSGKAVSITYCECVSVALGIRMQCACAILPPVACPGPQNFSALPHKWHDFSKTNY